MDFLLRVIAVTNENKAIPWSKINVPGRTKKSLQNMWTKINKELEEIRAQNESGEAAAASGTPTRIDPLPCGVPCRLTLSPSSQTWRFCQEQLRQGGRNSCQVGQETCCPGWYVLSRT